MIFQLALLLLGPSHFKHEWKWLLTLGMALIAIGGFIAFDASDKQSIFLIDSLGWVLLIVGIAEMGQSAIAQWDHSTPYKLSRAVTLIAVGGIVAFDPISMYHHDSFILGSAFAALGVFKVFFSVIAKYPHWRFILLNGVVNIVMGLLFFVEWERNQNWMIPLFFGSAIILMGISAVSNALMLRKSHYIAEGAGEEIGALDYFLRYHVGARYSPIFSRLPCFALIIDELKKPVKREKDACLDLVLRVWMPVESAENPVATDAKIPLLSRYIVVQDQKGCFSTGHSALQLDPGLYISHYPKEGYLKVKNEEQDKPDDSSIFEKAKANDEEGAFFESYDEESKSWMPSTRNIKIERFNEMYLRVYWNYYKMDSTYNIAERNCSVSVVMALDMALLGCLRGKNMLLRFFRLLLDKDLWVAAFLRRRAEEAVWTPGFVHDYALALNRVIKNMQD